MPDSPVKSDAQPASSSENTDLNHTNGDAAASEKVSLSLPENVNDGDEEQLSPAISARSENAENQDESSNVNDVVIKRRHKRLNRPLYYIGGNNGTHIVDDFLSSLGWERITDRNREDYKLKWCEIKSHNNYCSFREGDQLCYQIPNNKVLTTKIGLLTSLQEYERVMNKVKKGKPRIMKYQDFFPETYRLDVKEERENFCETYKDGEIWISKPTGLNQGKGIYLIRNREDIARFQGKMADIEEDLQTTRKLPFKVPMARIAQRYVTNPLLLDGKKFDVRNYMLVASTLPFVVFYRDGYCRLTCLPYDEESTDMTGHLTNQFMQKKNPLYQEIKEETVWSMDRFNDYVNERHMQKHDFPQDWVHTTLRKRCQQIMLHCFQSVRHKLECRLGFFDLYGCDFLVDDNFKVHLLEFNCNPALHTNCELLKEVIPSIVIESLKLALEIFNKAKAKERIMPLMSQEHVVLLYNGDLIEAEERREKLRTIAEQRKRARSAQRRKKFMANFNLRSYQGQRGSDGETETNNPTLAVTTALAPTVSNAAPVTTSVQAQVITNRLYPKVPPSTEVTNLSPPTTNPVTGSRSQTSLSTTSTTHSPNRVSASKSMPNITQKKPFYAGGTVPSRPFSAPRFHRNKKTENRQSTTTVAVQQNKNNSSVTTSNAETDVVTEKTVAASLNAKLKAYKPIEPTVNKNAQRQKEEKDVRHSKRSPEFEKKETEPKQQNRGRPRERVKYPRSKSVEEEMAFLSDALPESNSPTETEKSERILEANRKLLEAMTSSAVAIQAPSAKLPPSYHNKSSSVDIDFSKKYLAGIASSKKAQSNIIGKVNGMIRTYKAPLPSAVTFSTRDVATKVSTANEQLTQQQKVWYGSRDLSSFKMQYRSPTTVRVRRTLQATTCTLEIGPKARRGLVAIPNPVPTTITTAHQGSKFMNGNNVTRLRMMNAAGTYPPSTENEDISFPPGLKSVLEDSHLQLQSMADMHPFDDGSVMDGKQSKTTCVDSSTQTPISSYTLSSEEKVIWRLRTKVGATSNNTRLSTRPPVPSNEVGMKPSSGFPAALSGVKTYPGIMQQSPRYIAVRPSLGNGVTLVISPPPLVSGKNMLPTIRESRNNNGEAMFSQDDSSLYCDPALTPQLSQMSQTPTSDGEDDIPTRVYARTSIDETTQARLEDNSEKWMAPG